MSRAIDARQHVARRVSLAFPGCHAEFITSLLKHGGLAFRVVDARGRYRSNICRIYRGAAGITKADLRGLVKWARGRPDFPHLSV